MEILLLLLFAFIGALGNAMFAASQKKAIALGNSLAFLVISIFVFGFPRHDIGAPIGTDKVYNNYQTELVLGCYRRYRAIPHVFGF